jgi:iron(III) transport system ATP-binding protein
MTAQSLAPAPEREAAEALALRLQAVSHRYDGLIAVDDVSIDVGAGEIVCLVGPSGCGKSTLLRLAAGLEEIQQGDIWIGGRHVAGNGRSLPAERRGVGIVFQDYALFPHLNVLDNVRFGLSGMAARDQRGRAREVLGQIGMDGLREAYPHMLSGGQQQRVALARALAPQPKVMLLDEPFSGLDVTLRQQVRDETLHLLKENGTATLLVTHDPEEAMFLADRIALMRAGRLVQVGAPVDLYCAPANTFAASFFGEVNAMDGTVSAGRVETPFGPLTARPLADGTDVTVMIRPEGLRVALTGGGIGGLRARVETSRLLGRSSLIHLSVPDGSGHYIHMHARTSGVFLPAEDSYVTVSLDPTQAFVFAKESAA